MPNIAKPEIYKLYKSYLNMPSTENLSHTIVLWKDLSKQTLQPDYQPGNYYYHVIYLIAVSRKDLKNT